MVENKEKTSVNPQGTVEKDEKNKLKEEIDNIGKKKFGKFQDYSVFRKNLDAINTEFGDNGLNLLKIIIESGNFDDKFLLKIKKFYDHLKSKGYIEEIFKNLGENPNKLNEVLKSLKENYELGNTKQEVKKEGEQLKEQKQEVKKEGEQLKEEKQEVKKEGEQLKEQKHEEITDKGDNKRNLIQTDQDKVREITTGKDAKLKSAESIEASKDLLATSQRIQELKSKNSEYFGQEYEAKKQNHIQRLSSDPKFKEAIKSSGKFTENDIPALAEMCATREVIATTDISQKSPELTKQIVGDYDRFNAILGLNASSLGKMANDTELKNTNKSVKKFLNTTRIENIPMDQATDDKLKDIFTKKDGSDQSATENGGEGTQQPDEFEKKKAELLDKINVSSNNQIFDAFTGRVGELFNILSSSIPGGKLNNQIAYDRDALILDDGIEFEGDINGKKFYFVIDENGDFNFTDYFADKHGSIGIETKKLNNMFKFVPLSQYENISTTMQQKLPDIIKSSNSEEEILEKINTEIKNEADKLKKDAVVAKAELGYEINRFVNGTNYIPFYKPPTATYDYEYKGDYSNDVKLDTTKNKPLFEYMKLVKETMNHLPVKENSEIVELLNKIEQYSQGETYGDPNEDLLLSFQDYSKDNNDESGFNAFIQQFKTIKNGVEVLDRDKLQNFVEAMQKKQKFEYR